MTPPTAKPEASALTDAAKETSTDTAEGAGTDEAAPGAAARLASPGRRRAASLELRVARKRFSGEGDADDGGAPRAARFAGRGVSAAGPGAKGGTWTGPRARAARAALAEGAATAAAPAPVSLLPEAAPAEAPMFSSVRRSRPPGSGATPVTSAILAPTAAPPVDTPLVLSAARMIARHYAPDEVALAMAPIEIAAIEIAAIEKSAIEMAPVPAVIVEDDDGTGDRGPGPGGRRRVATRVERRGARAFKANDASNYVVAPTVNLAQMRPRHYGVIALFLLCVIVPTISYSWYLWTRAADQYESDIGFGSRTEEAPSTFDFLGALGGSAQSGSKDMDILNQFIISQELVAKIDADLDLKAIWSRPENDPLAAFRADGTIEDLVSYWQRMVLVNYDNGTGLMNLRVFAFDPQEARAIATAVLTESTNIINELSKTAQVDTTRYSKESLAATEAKLAEARLAVLDFQVRNNIVDPSNVVANQLSVVSTLNQQLASAQIDYDMLSGTVPATDLRLAQLSRRLEVIRNRITEEQAKVGATADSNSPGFAKLMADFERLRVDQDFAQAAYLSALAAHDQALTDAQQKTRYLATYVAPTLAEAPTAPNRPLTAALTALIGFLIWSVLVLTYYTLRDRR